MAEKKPSNMDEIQKNIFENENALKTYFNKSAKHIK